MLELTERDINEPATEIKTGEVGGNTEQDQLQAIENILKRVENITTAISQMTMPMRQQQAQQAQTHFPKTEKIGVKQSMSLPAEPQQPQPEVPYPSYPSEVNEPELTAENFKDYFDSPDEVVSMLEGVLAVLPDKILLSQASVLLKQNLEQYGAIEAKDARKQIKLFRPIIKTYLKQFFPKTKEVEKDVEQTTTGKKKKRS